MSSEQSEKFLEFKFERNRVIDLMTGASYAPPFRNEKIAINGHETFSPVYDMAFVHRVPLNDETPQLPERDDLMSDRLYEELKDEAYRKAMDNRKKNDEIRRRLHAFEKSGSIKIVKDPFSRNTVPDKREGKPTEEKPSAAPVRPARKNESKDGDSAE